MQMWTLGRYLPFAIGHLIPEDNEYWENYLRLLEIIDIVFARKVPMDECGYLESLIRDHHTSFKELYPEFNYNENAFHDSHAKAYFRIRKF